MATLADIDTKTLVSKFLERQIVTPGADGQADTADETKALLEAVAISFLLFPQVVLVFVLRAKNALQQVVQADLELIDYILSALADVLNPDVPVQDTSALTEAKTALVELDALGRVRGGLQAYVRYQAAVNNFLDRQLATSLKRHQRGELERSGVEARQDIVAALQLLAPTHAELIGRLRDLVKSVSDFQSVDISSIVSVSTISKVRASLTQLEAATQAGTISKTAAALELLAGAAALESISNRRGVYDPAIQTGVFPPRRTITVDSEPTAATASSSTGPWDIASATVPWNFSVAVDGGAAQVVELPFTGASNRVYVTSLSPGRATYVVPPGFALFLLIDGLYITAPLTSGGTVPLATLISDINTALGIHGTCAEFGTGSGRFIIYGAAGVAALTVLAFGRGTGTGGGYTPPASSGHSVLGFVAGQQSLAVGVFSSVSLADALASVSGVVLAVAGAALQLSSATTGLTTSLSFGAGVAPLFGFTGVARAEPSALLLTEDGDPVDPGTVGVFVGSIVETAETGGGRSISEPVTALDGGRLVLRAPLPNGIAMATTITAPIVVLVKTLISNLTLQTGNFDNDILSLQKTLGPLFSHPSLAQANDASRSLKVIRARLASGDLSNPALLETLQAASLPPARSEFDGVASDIVNGMQTRSLDRAITLLSRCRFSAFFALDKEAAASGSRLLQAMSSAVRNDLPTSIVEDDDDGSVLSSNPDSDLLPGSSPAEQ